MTRSIFLAILACLIIPTTAQAYITPLARGNTITGSTGFAIPGGPFEGGSLGFHGPSGPWAFFQATVGWDTATGNLYVGCRGHGAARVWVRVGHVARSVVCRNVQAWRLVNHATAAQHVFDAMVIRAVPRRVR